MENLESFIGSLQILQDEGAIEIVDGGLLDEGAELASLKSIIPCCHQEYTYEEFNAAINHLIAIGKVRVLDDESDKEKVC